MRLQKWIAKCSHLSRRSAEQAITDGRISVNDTVITILGSQIDPDNDIVRLDNHVLSADKDYRYIAYYKPRFKMVTKSDPEGRETIWNDLSEFKSHYNSAGRLDFDSEGLLIITNDGDVLNALTHPKHNIWKTYLVRIHRPLLPKHKVQLTKGVALDDGQTLPAIIRNCDLKKGHYVEVQIREGKNRQIRRMFEALAYDVLMLKRLSIGSIKLENLTPGTWRDIDQSQINSMQQK